MRDADVTCEPLLFDIDVETLMDKVDLAMNCCHKMSCRA